MTLRILAQRRDGREPTPGLMGLLLALNLSPIVVRADEDDDRHRSTASPVEHVVVIFQENVSFDHYVATYPDAANPPGEPGVTRLASTTWSPPDCSRRTTQTACSRSA